MGLGPKATSTRVDGSDDGFEIQRGFQAEMTSEGETRLVVCVPTEDLRAVHLALISALEQPLGVLYRRLIDRRDPKPQGTPPSDFVGLGLSAEQVTEALITAEGLVWHDARCEIWLRGGLKEQLVLDADGVLFCYPDDPAFRDALAAHEVRDRPVEGMHTRDYVKHWFHAENDALQDLLIEGLGLQAVPHRKS